MEIKFCPVCESKEFMKIGEDQNREYFKCRCGADFGVPKKIKIKNIK